MSKKVRVLILEDEFITLDNLKETIIDLGYAVSGTAMTAQKAIGILEQGTTDIAILDIKIKGDRSGIWVAEQIRDKYQIPFIFLTAFSDKNTLKPAAETLPAGYLVKPFTTADIYSSIEIAIQKYQQTSFQQETSEREVGEGYIYIKEDYKFIKIALADLMYVEVIKNYLQLQLTNNRQHLIRSTLKQFKDQLSEHQFLQPHRSFLVNEKYIEKVGPNAIWVNETEIPISRRMKEAFFSRIRLS